MLGEYIVGDNSRLLVWGKDSIEDNTIEQAQRVARLPFVPNYVALMPDAHFGYGACVGSVIPTSGAIVPYAIGVDIGCGMIAVETNFMVDQLPDDLDKLHHSFERSIPAGKGGDHQGEVHAFHDQRVLALYDRRPFIEDRLTEKALRQCGTLGGGNHFVEVTYNQDGVVWIVLHSGSRGIGNILATQHIDVAKDLMKKFHIELEDPNLAYLPEGTAEFDSYIKAMLWCQDYALVNRELMMDAALKDLRHEVPMMEEMRRIQCHHNFTEQENHFGKNLWVTRKGAVRARTDDVVIIPGSMSDGTYIARGLGDKASLNSCSHGAGRVLGRKEAKRRFTAADLTERMKGISWDASKAAGLVDEISDAYKPIEEVMAAQADLVEPLHVLKQVLSFKGD